MELLFLVLFSLHILKTEAVALCRLPDVVQTVGVDALEQTDVLLCWCIQEHHSSKFKNHWSPDSSLFLVTYNEWATFCTHSGPSRIIKAQFKDHLEQVGQHWCYLSQKKEEPSCEDPRLWHMVDAKCKGSKQSPINIVTKNVIYDKNLTPLHFENYDVKGTSKWTIENNGHTVKVTLDTNAKIGSGGLNRTYKAVEFHLHWGIQEEQLYFPGSEHSIDGEKQAMELHIVHIREDALDLADAKNYADGIAVLAFFIKIDEENKNYATLISELDNILQKDTSSQMEPLPLNSLLPPVYELRKYYRYEGSLTTPDCHETVIWTVFEKPIQLSLSQVSQFSSVHFGGNNSTFMSENFRPAQFLNGRYVYWSSASSLLPPAKVLMLALILLYLLNSLFQ